LICPDLKHEKARNLPENPFEKSKECKLKNFRVSKFKIIPIMKKFSLLIPAIFLILSGPLLAQLEAGKLMVGVASTFNTDFYNSDLINLSFSAYKTKYSGTTSPANKLFNINVIPRAGYFVINNLATGLDIYFSQFREKNGYNDSKETTTQVCIVPFVRYYYPLLWCYPFVELNGGIGTQKFKRVEPAGGSGSMESKYGINTFSGMAGIAKPIGSRATFDIMAGYSRTVVKHETDQKNTYGSFIVRMAFVVFFLQQEPQY
jgi:hypothetical protein